MLDGFHVIRHLKPGKCFILTIGENGCSFNKHVAGEMRRARYVQCLINLDTKQFAIQKCDEYVPDKILFFRDESNCSTGIRFNVQKVTSTLANMMGWDLEQYNVKAVGAYDVGEEAMIFNLDNDSVKKVPRRRKRR